VIRWVDVPFAGPQLLAFPTAEADLSRFRRALELMLEQGDVGLLRELWDELIDGYRRARVNARWRVPAATLRAVADLLEERSEAVRDERIRASSSMSAAATRRWLGDRTELTLHPDVWFVVAGPVARLRHGLMLDYYAESLAQELERIRADTTPLADQLCFWSGAPISESESFDIDWALQRADNVLEMLVEPYSVSRGPGPFFMPGAARPLVAPSSNWLPRFHRAESGAASLCERASSLYGAAVVDTIEAIGRAKDLRWFRNEEERSYYPVPSHSEWLSFEDCTPHWPRCRQRFLGLLQEVRDTDQSILLLRELPCDQGPIEGPFSERWGCRATGSS
jgi:hypothetical protein